MYPLPSVVANPHCLASGEQLLQQTVDIGLHLRIVLLDAQQEVKLVVGAHEVVVGVLTLPVLVAAEVVPEEADTLHVGEEGRGVGEVLYLDGQQEALGALEVTFGEGLEDVHAELHLVHVGARKSP